MKALSKEGKKLTVTEAAEYLGVSLRKMAQLIKDGDIAFQTDPLDKRRRLLSVADLDRLKKASINIRKGKR